MRGWLRLPALRLGAYSNARSAGRPAGSLDQPSSATCPNGRAKCETATCQPSSRARVRIDTRETAPVSGIDVVARPPLGVCDLDREVEEVAREQQRLVAGRRAGRCDGRACGRACGPRGRPGSPHDRRARARASRRLRDLRARFGRRTGARCRRDRASSRNAPNRPDARGTGRSGTAAIRRRRPFLPRDPRADASARRVARPRHVDRRPGVGSVLLRPRRVRPERPDAGVDEHVARRVSAAGTRARATASDRRRRTPTDAAARSAAQSTVVARCLVRERERRPALAHRDHLDLSQPERRVRHATTLARRLGRVRHSFSDRGPRARPRRRACPGSGRARSTSAHRSRRVRSACSRERSDRSPASQQRVRGVARRDDPHEARQRAEPVARRRGRPHPPAPRRPRAPSRAGPPSRGRACRRPRRAPAPWTPPPGPLTSPTSGPSPDRTSRTTRTATPGGIDGSGASGAMTTSTSAHTSPSRTHGVVQERDTSMDRGELVARRTGSSVPRRARSPSRPR